MSAPSIAPTPEQGEAKIQALLNGPAAPPPVGMVSNFDDPPNLNAIVIGIVTACLALTTLAVLIRICTKLFIIRSRACEDYTIVLAWVGQVGFAAISVFCFKVGGGSHMWDIRLKNYFQLLYWVNIAGILFGMIICLVKVSILLQYSRIFVPNRKGNMALFVAIQSLIWTVILFYFVDTIFGIIMCIPREKIWNRLMTAGHCFNAHTAYKATGLFNVISDIFILILPVKPIWKLQMALKKKLMMIAIFATGIFACVTSIIRTSYTWEIEGSPDVSYTIIIMGLCTWAEVTSGTIVCCLPVIPRFIQRFSPKIYKSLTIGSKSESKVRYKPESTDTKCKIGVSVHFNQRFEECKGGNCRSETWCDANSTRINSPEITSDSTNGMRNGQREIP